MTTATARSLYKRQQSAQSLSYKQVSSRNKEDIIKQHRIKTKKKDEMHYGYGAFYMGNILFGGRTQYYKTSGKGEYNSLGIAQQTARSLHCIMCA